MEKTITFNEKLGTKMQPVRIQNHKELYTIEIQKASFFLWCQRIAVLLVLTAFIATLVFSYNTNATQFWSLVPVGLILGCIGIVAYKQK